MLQLKKHVPSGTIILNRQDQRNALSRAMLAELKQAFSDFHQEKAIRAVIVTGAGSSFCSGVDLREVQASRESDQAMAIWHEDVMAMRELVHMILRFPKPVIAAVNGAAAGLGAALVLASDIVVGSPDASVVFPEGRRGLAPGLVTPLLAFRVGAGLAANVLLTGRVVDAEECLRHGLFHECVAGDALWARSHEIAEMCAASAPQSIQITKQLLNETVGDHLNTSLTSGAAASASARTTDSATEGVDAFLEKREPNW